MGDKETAGFGEIMAKASMAQAIEDAQGFMQIVLRLERYRCPECGYESRPAFRPGVDGVILCEACYWRWIAANVPHMELIREQGESE